MKYDLIIIGSGPAGYVAAIRAGQTGLKTLVIDKKYVGGMCLNWGCIPSKTLLESAKLYHKITQQAQDFGIDGIKPEELSFNWLQAVKRSNAVVAKLTRGIEFLWKKNAVEYLQAEAKIVSEHSVQAGNETYEAEHILIATGSRPAPQNLFPQAIEIEGLYQLDKLPDKPVLYGRGAIIAELAQFFSLTGRQVAILQSDSPLIPGLDSYLESFIIRKLKKEKIQMFQTEETTITPTSIQQGDRHFDYDAVFNCSLRKAVMPLMEIELEQKDGYLVTDEDHRTSVPNIFAAGDVNGKSYLAHVASAQALRVIDAINGVASEITPYYPINIYTEPEIAQIGITEQQLKDLGQEYLAQEFNFNANGKALAEGNAEGFIRLLYEPKYHQVLGVQIAGVNATDLIAEAAVLMQLEGTVYDLANTVHAHPTVAEVFFDAAKTRII